MNENTAKLTVPGTYECHTRFLRECETRMVSDPTIEWADVLTDNQSVCLFWVLRQVEDACTDAAADAAVVFAMMIDVDGNMVVTVGDGTVTVDFQHDTQEDQS